MRVRGSGIAVPSCPTPDGPKDVVTNADMLGVLGYGELSLRKQQAMQRMIAASGGQRRHWSHWVGSEAREDEATAIDLATEAASAALRDAGLQASDLDLVILALNTSPMATLPSASPLCARLGYMGPSFDLKAGCAGSVYSLQWAAMSLANGYRRVLVVGSDTMSKYVDAQALSGFLNVGDGAGALVLEAAPEPNFACLLGGEYSTWDHAGVFGSMPPRQADIDSGAFYYRGAPTQTRDLVVARYRDGLQELVARTQVGMDELALWIPHQVSLPILQDVHRSLGRPDLRMVTTIERYGNTGAASLLMALHEVRHERPEGWCALSALGGGMRWGSALWKGWT